MTSTLGQTLRAAREAQGHTLDDVEGVTRIRAKHLAALENDDYNALPSPAQARGFIKNYAQHLGLDLQEVLGQYEAAQKRRGPAARLKAEAIAPPRREAPPRPPRRNPARESAPPSAASAAPPVRRPSGPPAQTIRTRRPRLLSADILVAVVITLALAALLVWGAGQVFPSLLGAATVTVTAFNATAGTLGPGTTPSPAPPTATPPPPTSAQTFSGVNVTVSAEQRVWVSVTVDGAEVFAGLMPPGEAREFIGQSVVEVTTGNGLGTRVTWNGVDQGVLGDLGEVVTRLWTLQGMVVPTPAPEPSAAP